MPIYRPFQYYLDKADGDTRKASLLERFSRDEVYAYKQALLQVIDDKVKEAIKVHPNTPKGRELVGLMTAQLIIDRFVLDKFPKEER